MRNLKILMCAQFPLKANLGGPKGYLEVAETYRARGHHVDLVGINEIVGEDKPYLDELWRIYNFPEYLKAYLLKNANNYDVVEYEAIYLPFNIKDEVRSILVARSVLLEMHLRKIKIPIFPGPKAFFSHLAKSWIRNRNLNKRINQSYLGMKFADVVNVSNPSDKNILIEAGIEPDKIVMQPYGISEARLNQFKSARLSYTHSSGLINVAFVGSFDKRKGAVEFPDIIRSITKKYPQVRFKLMGVVGMFPNSESIYNYLGKDLKEKVVIIDRYAPNDLPNLLKDCSFGIFPSHLESFGYGVLEMMAMDLPVVGYNSPGLSMLIPSDLLVERGNKKEMVERLSKLIEDENFSERCRKLCSEKVMSFIYETQHNSSLETYFKKI